MREELIQTDEGIKLLVPCDGEQSGYDLVDLFRWNCIRCGEEITTPEPNYPSICPNPNCSKQKCFESLFPQTLRKVWDNGFKVPWFLPGKPIWEDTQPTYALVRECIRRHVSLSQEDLYDLLACWVMASWKLEHFVCAPYLLFRGEHESGKTRALEILARLCYRAIPTVGMSAALLYRQIEAFKCTCLIDQAEDQLDRRHEEGQRKYAVVAAGYRRGMFVGVCEKEDPDRVRYHDCFGFKAMASSRSFDAAIDSRQAAIIDMQEATPELEDIDEEMCARVRSVLLGFRLRKIVISTPETKLRRRARELYIPPLAIAKLVGSMTFESIEGVGEREYQRRRRELVSEFNAMIIEMILELEPQAYQQLDAEAGRVNLAEVKAGLQERGVEVSTRQIGKALANMGFERGRSHGGKRYIDLEQNRDKLNYYREKFGL